MAVAGLRGMVEKVGRSRTGFNNHHIHGVKRTMLLGFFGAVNPVNVNTYQHHLLSRRSYATHGRRLSSPFSAERPLDESEIRDNWYGHQKALSRQKIAVENLFSHQQRLSLQLDSFRKEVLPAFSRMERNFRRLLEILELNEEDMENRESSVEPSVLPLEQTKETAAENPSSTQDDLSSTQYQIRQEMHERFVTMNAVLALGPIDKQDTSYSVENAMAVLRNLPDVKSCDDIFFCGSKLFLKDINREMFLKGLQTDQERLAWLQMHLARDRGSQSKVDQSFSV